MSRTSGGRGLILVLVALLLLAAMVDLLRPGSLIRGAWRNMNQPQTPIERAVKEFTKGGRPATPPRSNRLDHRGTRSVISAAQAPRPT